MPHSDDGNSTAGSRRRVGHLTRLARVATLTVAAALVAGAAGGLHPLLDLASHFQLQYAGVAAITLVFLLATRSRCWAVLAAIVLVASGARLVPWALPAAAPDPDPHASPLRVLQLNVHTANRRFDAVPPLLERWSPDLVVLQEVDDDWLEALAAVRESWPHRLEVPRDDNFGMAVWSRHPFVTTAIERLGPSSVPTLVVTLDVHGTAVTVVAAHPPPPRGVAASRHRDAEFDGLARRVGALGDHVLLVGDLNATMWSSAYRRLVEATGLLDARRGHGLRPTWPAALPGILRIPIDHCLHGPAIRVRDCRVGTSIGSDHRPLIVDLSVASPG